MSVLVFAFVLGAAAVWWTFAKGNGVMGSVPVLKHMVGAPVPAEEGDAAPAQSVHRRAIDGVPLAEPEESADLVAVVMDNFPIARPAAGIAHAPLVIEAPVEGGITRLLAIYPADHALDRIGPVRSARPYFVDWAEEYDAMFVHVGGSDAALAQLRGSDLRNIDEFGAGAYFWRDRGRYAPHNAYTSAELLAVAERKRFDGRVSHPLPAWEYKEDAPVAERPEGGAVEVRYANEEYGVTWRYDAAENAYARYQGGKPFADEDGTPVLAKNVIVQYTKVRVIDDVGRREIATRGEGGLLLARDGIVETGVWRREGDGRFRLYGTDDSPLTLNAGTTWIEVVPLGTEIGH